MRPSTRPRIEQRTDQSLKGTRWTLLKEVSSLKPASSSGAAASRRCGLPDASASTRSH
jgi:hypothetical protein